MTTFVGTGTTPKLEDGGGGYDTRTVLYYWSISGLTEAPVKGSITVKLSNSSESETGIRTDGNLVLFSCGTRTYPNIDAWGNRNSNCAYKYLEADDNNVSYFYVNNTNFSNLYPHYVVKPLSLNFPLNKVDYEFNIDFEIPSAYRDLNKWNNNNIFYGICPTNLLYDGAGYIQWGAEVTSDLTLTTASNRVYYYTGSKWQECEPYYYDGSKWVKTSIKYYTDSTWN